MNSANPSPADQMDGVDQCQHCKARFVQDDDDDRCPDCGRMLSPEVCITFEESKGCPWGTPIRAPYKSFSRNVEIVEEAEIQDGAWMWVLNGRDIDDREHLASEQDCAALDRLYGWMLRKGIK